MSPGDFSLPANGYVIDGESGAELARLLGQDHLLTACLGDLLPKGIRLAKGKAVLDLACGPGGWVLAVARRYPEIQVIGLDLSRKTIEYARSLARVQGLENAAFVVMDVTQPLDFPDDSFALVNGRLLMSCLSSEAWSSLVRECLRVTRPGGIIRLTDCERGLSTSPALEELTALATLALKMAGHSFSPDGRTVGITPVLGRLLREVGCEQIRQRASVLDYSVDTPLYGPMVQNAHVAWFLLKPFLLKMGVVTPERFEELYRQMQMELLADDFCALWFYLSVWGRKPGR